MVSGEGRQVVDVHMDVDEAVLQLHHTVGSLLCILLVIEEEEASCLIRADLIFVAGRRARPVEKNLPCGEISNFYTSAMGRNLKFLHMWSDLKFLHMKDVEKSEISFVVCTIYGILLHFTLFCCKICIFLVFYAVLSQNRVFVIYALLCGEKFSQK